MSVLVKLLVRQQRVRAAVHATSNHVVNSDRHHQYRLVTKEPRREVYEVIARFKCSAQLLPAYYYYLGLWPSSSPGLSFLDNEQLQSTVLVMISDCGYLPQNSHASQIITQLGILAQSGI